MKSSPLIILVFVFIFSIAPPAQCGDQSALEKRLVYLKNLPEVHWVLFISNHVYAGVDPLPRNIGMISNAAALNGYRASGRSVHIYIVPAADKKLIPGGRWRLYCSATCRRGKITKNTCK